MSALTMVASAAAIIAMVKYGLLHGISHIAGAMRWNAKLRGQVTGYATSVPEFVCLVAAGLSGVWEAGLWNIASSNIINAVLMMMAVLYYRRFNDLLNRRFVDEVVFAALAIVVPIVLMQSGMDKQWLLIPLLLGFFVAYQVVDKRVNRPAKNEEPHEQSAGHLPFGIILGISSLVGVAIAGMFLGNSTAHVVDELGVHPATAGWILGFVTSIPEMVSFFAVYATAGRSENIASLEETQEVLDNMTSSNMSNVGIIYPIGLLAFLIGSSLIGG